MSEIFLSGANALRRDGSVAGLGDAASQADAALDWLDEALSAVGGSLANLTKLTTNVVDRGYRTDVYRTHCPAPCGTYAR